MPMMALEGGGSESKRLHLIEEEDNPMVNKQLQENDEKNMADGEENAGGGKNVWICSAVCAAICFSFGNEGISIVTAQVDGLACIFYLSFGSWICGIIYQIVMCIVNRCDPTKDYVWHPNNLIINGKLVKVHLVIFILMSFLFMGIMISMYMTMYFSHMSGVNVGVITTFWSIQPLVAAVLDLLINREMLGFHHIVGMILVILGAVSIGYSGINKQNDGKHLAPNNAPTENPNSDMTFHPVIQDPKSPMWIAILWGFITPCFFIARAMYAKFIT